MTDSNPTSVFSLENSGTGILRDVTLIKKYGWTQHSIVSWSILSRYWLVNAYYCKDFSNSNEHEFIIYEFVDEHKKELILRSDRNVGAPIDTPSSSCTTSYVINCGLSNGSKASPPLSHSFSSYSSDMSSDRYLARDTIRIERRPRHHEALKTITFRGDRSSRPSLWDVVVLVWLLHNNRPFYNPLLHQCYWFADTIFGILEKWPNGMAVHGEKGKVKQGRRHASIGCYHGTHVHNRNMEVIVKVWDDFEKERQVLTQKVGIFI